MNKARRQEHILQLISKHPVASQFELVRLLRENEISAAQASVSRDIRELGLIKVDGSYVQLSPSATSGANGSAHGRNELITSITPVGANLIVVRTKVGAASVVAAQLDSQRSPEIIGTLAGDDTIFIAIRSRAAQGRVSALLRSPALR